MLGYWLGCGLGLSQCSARMRNSATIYIVYRILQIVTLYRILKQENFNLILVEEVGTQASH